MTGKPTYRVPLMAEIAGLPWNGLTVVSTFAGAGGSSTGYRMAGYRVLLANEFVPIAQESYAANMGPYTVLAPESIKDLTGPEILRRIGLKEGELDVLDGSPPCQAFSTAGKREKGWGTERQYEHGASQRNEDLFDEYIRLVHWLRPRTFVAENVSGLVKGTAKGYFLRILAALKTAGPGYVVEARLLDAQWLGVPQARQRIIFVGVRADLARAGFTPAFPEPLPYRYSVRDALPWITRAVHDTSGLYGAGDITNRPAPTITTGILDAQGRALNSNHFKVEARKIQNRDSVPENVAASLEGYAIGAEWDKLNPGQSSDKFFSLVRPDPGKPCPTITSQGVGSESAGGPGNTASVTHPTEKRKFSIGELKRICAFPDDFVLKGTYGQQWERLGNSVPPVMMMHVAAALRDRILIPARSIKSAPSPRKTSRRRPAL